MNGVIADTGLLISLFKSKSKSPVVLDSIEMSLEREFVSFFSNAPLLTCDAVLVETLYHFEREHAVRIAIFRFLRSLAMKVDFSITKGWGEIERISSKYPHLDFADVCVVRMSEQFPQYWVATVDTDFLGISREIDVAVQQLPLLVRKDLERKASGKRST